MLNFLDEKSKSSLYYSSKQYFFSVELQCFSKTNFKFFYFCILNLFDFIKQINSQTKIKGKGMSNMYKT
jgi:hypothetical protein